MLLEASLDGVAFGDGLHGALELEAAFPGDVVHLDVQPPGVVLDLRGDRASDRVEDVEGGHGGQGGKYLEEIGAELASEFGNRFLDLPRGQGVREIGEIGLNRMLESIEKNLLQLGVAFDVWFRERQLFEEKQYDTVMKLLTDNGFVAEREGATWFTSTSLGNEKDNVLVRGTGQPTYFASDAAYHYDKFSLVP